MQNLHSVIFLVEETAIQQAVTGKQYYHDYIIQI